jgi:tRNA pseudouridine55 synthase
MYSALKREGQPLYKLARAGVEVERAARNIEIFALELLEFPTPRLELQVLCSKGTYVRTLAEDFAKTLGTCGHVQALRRVHVEPFEDARMETLESISEALAGGRDPTILPADAPLQHLLAVHLDPKETGKVLHGQAVIVAGTVGPARVRLYDAAGAFIGIGEADGTGAVRPKRLFNLSDER